MEELPTQNSGVELMPDKIEAAKRKLKPAEAPASAEQTGMPPPPALPIPATAAPPLAAMPDPTTRDDYFVIANVYLKRVEEIDKKSIFARRLIGRALNQAKLMSEHGDWGKDLKKHFNGSPETARVYMRIDDRWGDLEPEMEREGGMTLERARYLLRRETKGENGAPVKLTTADELMVADLEKDYADNLQNWPPMAIRAIHGDKMGFWNAICHWLHSKCGIVLKDATDPNTGGTITVATTDLTLMEKEKAKLRLHTPPTKAEPDEWDDWEAQPAAAQPKAAMG